MIKAFEFIKNVLKTDSFHSAIKQLAYALSIIVFITATRHFLPFPILSSILQIVLWIVVIGILFAITRSLLLTSYRMKQELPFDHYDNYTAAIINLLRMLKILVIFGVILQVLNVAVTDFLTSISIFAVALVLIFKEYITNLINGLVLLFSPIYQIGNYIEVDDIRGKIIDINLINITIRDERRQKIHIPNSTVLTKQIINISQSKEKIIIVKIIQPKDKVYELFKETFQARINLLLEKHSGIKSISFDIVAIEKDSYTLEVAVSVSGYTLAKEREIRALINNAALQQDDANKK